MKLVVKVVYWLVFGALILIALLVSLSALNIPGGIKLYTVQSGSMAPEISVGSVVISRGQNEYLLDDIITFKTEEERNIKNPKTVITHRIVEIHKINELAFFRTKGDANDSPDATLVPEELVLGKILYSVPFIGYPVSYAKTRNGLIVLVVIPATLFIYSELISIKNETKKLLKERKTRRLTTKEKLEVKIGKEEIKAEKRIKKFFSKICSFKKK